MTIHYKINVYSLIKLNIKYNTNTSFTYILKISEQILFIFSSPNGKLELPLHH